MLAQHLPYFTGFMIVSCCNQNGTHGAGCFSVFGFPFPVFGYGIGFPSPRNREPKTENRQPFRA